MDRPEYRPPASFIVEPEPESVTAARHFALLSLGECGMADQLGEDVGLVVSELVTNALRHGVPTTSPMDAPPRLFSDFPDFPDFSDPRATAEPRLVLRVMCRAPWVLCGITDPCSAAPRRREPDYIAETGRGLHLVESFSVRWGWNGLPDGGKVVWALFHLP